MKALMRALAIFLFLLTSPDVTVAQTDSAAEMVELLDGLETAHGRFATFDFSAPADVDPSAMWMMLGAYIFAFDSEEAAAAAIAPLTEHGPIVGLAADMDGARIESIAPDLEFPSTALVVESDDDGVTWTTMQVMVQDGEHVFMVFGMAGGLDPSVTLATLLAGMLEATSSSEPERFRADGSSTGGTWERMPTAVAIHADAPELTAVEDQLFLADTLATPAASRRR